MFKEYIPDGGYRGRNLNPVSYIRTKVKEINMEKPFQILRDEYSFGFLVLQEAEDSFLKYRKFDFLGWVPDWQKPPIIKRQFTL